MASEPGERKAGTGGTWHKHIILLKTWQESFQTWQNSNCVCKNQRNFEEEQVLSSFPLTPSLTVRCTGAWSGYAFNQLIWYHTITLLPLWFRTKLLMLTTIYRRSSSWDINYTTTSLVFFQSQSSEKSACCIYVEWFLVICKETNTTKLSAQGGNLLPYTWGKMEISFVVFLYFDLYYENLSFMRSLCFTLLFPGSIFIHQMCYRVKR